METQITLVFRPKKKSVTVIQHETAAISEPTTNGSPTATVNSAPRTYFRRKNSPKVLANARNWIVIPTCAHRSLVSLTIADAIPLLPPFGGDSFAAGVAQWFVDTPCSAPPGNPLKFTHCTGMKRNDRHVLAFRKEFMWNAFGYNIPLLLDRVATLRTRISGCVSLEVMRAMISDRRLLVYMSIVAVPCAH
jgi:hypothetical protein